MGNLKSDLGSEAQELRETHISWVFLHQDVAYKVKKPVEFDFLDFSTLEKRRRACEAELELNRRLAADVYLGLVPVTREGGRHRLGGPGEVVDWAVCMRRLLDADRADVMLSEGRLTVEHIDLMAARLVEFHRAAPCDDAIRMRGMPEAISRDLRDNFEGARSAIREYLTEEQVTETETWQHRFVREHSRRFVSRAKQGYVRDGHGDLKLEHFYFSGNGLVVVDCIEFNAAFRYLDTCSDVAFTAMDLCGHGRVELAERLLSSYAAHSNDYEAFRLVDFYESYRATIRGKVAALLSRDLDAPFEVRERARALARRYFLLALASERRRVLTPAVVAVAGIIGSGKSTVADGLGALLGAPVVSSDRTRKHLLEVSATTPLELPAFAGAYGEATSERVYAELFARARHVLASGRPVILDASFRARRHRDAARALARELLLPFHLVECRAPLELCRERLERRQRTPGPSDGRSELLDAFADAFEPIEEADRGGHLVVDTSLPLAQNLAQVSLQLPSWAPIGEAGPRAQ